MYMNTIKIIFGLLVNLQNNNFVSNCECITIGVSTLSHMEVIVLFMKKIKLILAGAICVLLSGCATDSLHIQLTPDEDSLVVLKDKSETVYILPSSFNVEDITFRSYNSKVSSSTYEKLFWYFEQDTLIVERRTDNGGSGSSVVYEIERKTLPDSHKVIFVPKLEKKHQDGLVLPYAVPQFDINLFLATTYYKHEFEVDSEYTAEAIKSNFKREFNDKHVLDLDNARVEFSVEVYPYRKGSKAVIQLNIKTIPSHNSLINIEALYEKIELRLTSVINA